MSIPFAAKLGSRFALLLAGRMLLLILGLATTAILTRALGPAGFGYYRAGVAYLGLVVVLVDFGLVSVFVREISRAGADQPRIVGNALTLRLAIAVCAMLIAVGLAFVLDFEPATRLGIVGGSFGFVAYSLHLMIFGIFQQKLRQQGVVLAEISGGVVLLATILVLVRSGAEPYWFVTALGGSYVFTLAVSLFFARRLIPFSLRVERAQWAVLGRAAAPLAASGVLTVLYVRADSVLLALLQTPEAVGLYGVPVKISDSALGISLLLTGLFAPLFAHAAHRDAARFSQHLRDGMSAMLIGSIGFALALNALASEIVVLLGGAEFAPAAPMLRWLTVFLVAHSLTLILREAAIALHAQQRLVRAYAIGALVAFAAYAPLILRYGGSGAAATLVIAEFVVLGLVWRVVRTAAGVRVSLRIPAAAVLSGLAAAVVLFVLSGTDTAWWMRLAVTMASYLLMLVVTRALDPSLLVEIARSMLQLRDTRP